MNKNTTSGTPNPRLLRRAAIALATVAITFGVIVGFGPIGPPHANTTPAAIQVGATPLTARVIR